MIFFTPIHITEKQLQTALYTFIQFFLCQFIAFYNNQCINLEINVCSSAVQFSLQYNKLIPKTPQNHLFQLAHTCNTNSRIPFSTPSYPKKRSISIASFLQQTILFLSFYFFFRTHLHFLQSHGFEIPSLKKKGVRKHFPLTPKPGQKKKVLPSRGGGQRGTKNMAHTRGRKKGHPDLKTFSSSFDYYFFFLQVIFLVPLFFEVPELLLPYFPIGFCAIVFFFFFSSFT